MRKGRAAVLRPASGRRPARGRGAAAGERERRGAGLPRRAGRRGVRRGRCAWPTGGARAPLPALLEAGQAAHPRLIPADAHAARAGRPARAAAARGSSGRGGRGAARSRVRARARLPLARALAAPRAARAPYRAVPGRARAVRGRRPRPAPGAAGRHRPLPLVAVHPAALSRLHDSPRPAVAGAGLRPAQGDRHRLARLPRAGGAHRRAARAGRRTQGPRRPASSRSGSATGAWRGWIAAAGW